MRNLKELCASGNCGIDQKGIKGLDSIKLDASGNSKINNVNRMINLKELDASENFRINQLGINELDLIKLNVWNNPNIILKLDENIYKIKFNFIFNRPV